MSSNEPLVVTEDDAITFYKREIAAIELWMKKHPNDISVALDVSYQCFKHGLKALENNKEKENEINE